MMYNKQENLRREKLPKNTQGSKAPSSTLNFITFATIKYRSLNSFELYLVCNTLENDSSSIAKKHLHLPSFWLYFRIEGEHLLLAIH